MPQARTYKASQKLKILTPFLKWIDTILSRHRYRESLYLEDFKQENVPGKLDKTDSWLLSCLER